MNTFSVLVFHFVMVCSPVYGVDWEYAPTLWGDSKYSCWTDRGPFFTNEDCEDARSKSLWSFGTSLCYAHTVVLKDNHS